MAALGKAAESFTIGYLKGYLSEQLTYNINLLTGVKEDVEMLANDLGLLESMVRGASSSGGSGGGSLVMKEIVDQIRDAVYESEDAVDAYITCMAVHQSRGRFNRFFHGLGHTKDLRDIAREIKSAREKVSNIYQHRSFGFGRLLDEGSGGGGSSSRTSRVQIIEEENVVGFDDDAKIVIDCLTGGSSNLEVISIVGMPGLGKTTLAKRIYKDLEIKSEFPIHAWADASEGYTRKEVFSHILRSIPDFSKEIEGMNDHQLAEELRKSLKDAKYLIVLDDVWSRDDWNGLRIGFPNNTEGSRVLITTRNKNVAVQANYSCHTHNMKFLTLEESWELLQLKVFGKEMCPPDSELRVPGKQIAEKCGGVPLTIVTTAETLMGKDYILDDWEEVAKGNLNLKVCNDAVELSYDQLPYNLKGCFLYFGIFPKNFEIPVWMLTRLWIAEGFIRRLVGDEKSLEVIAEGYLQDLINRSMVILGQQKWNGQAKTCHILPMFYEFCKNKAAEENFFHEIKGQASTTTFDKHRRVSIHSNVLNYFRSAPSGQRVHSLLCYGTEEIVLDQEEAPSVLGGFTMLRVLEIRPIKFQQFPTMFDHLVHLKYLALSGNFTDIPEGITGLWNLQTLIIETSSRVIEIKGEELWKMTQLRHIHSNAITHLPSPPSNAGDVNIQTLSTISPESCTDDVLGRTPNLKKLGVRGKLSDLLGQNGESPIFDNVGKLQFLENLKLLNDGNDIQYGGKLLALPQAHRFPPKLKKLTLSHTCLDWRIMSTLAMLDNLEVLMLKENAFQGEWWNPMDAVFRRLKVLHIGGTNISSWEASAHHFPGLQRLLIRNCSNLRLVPHSLAEINSLKKMELYNTTSEAARSARDIANKKQETQGIDTNEFLSIYPSDHGLF